MLKLLVGALLLSVAAAGNLTPNRHLTESDRERFKQILQLKSPYTADNLVSTYYSVAGLNVLYADNIVAAVPAKDRTDICTLTKTVINEANNLENLYFATSAAKILNCPVSSRD